MGRPREGPSQGGRSDGPSQRGAVPGETGLHVQHGVRRMLSFAVSSRNAASLMELPTAPSSVHSNGLAVSPTPSGASTDQCRTQQIKPMQNAAHERRP